MSLATYFQSVAKAPAEGLSRFADLLLVAGIVAIISLMILPLPNYLIDFLVAVNMAMGLTLLLIAVYIGSPLEFSVFPSVLLISTLFRLALSIATTKMILLHGEAGHIIDTFGNMVAGGNLVVGLVVFLIITVVQFIVVAKGAERVAEVAARFSLDAMPGKQLSIDSDLRSGLIDKDEARRKRHDLELESKLHGSMDGAMKFVKGDAIAGIVIIVINLLGGLAVGVMQQGMTMSHALVKYSILTIGDGMVTQIPALLAAMSAGLIVTRTTDEEKDKNLGEAIHRQLAAKPKVLLVGGGLCWLLALVPGFPSIIFIMLGSIGLLAGSLLTPVLRARLINISQPALNAIKRDSTETTAPTVVTTALVEVRPSVPLLLEVSDQVLSSTKAPDLVRNLEEVLDGFQLTLGLNFPRISVHAFSTTQNTIDSPLANEWRLHAFEVPIAQGRLEKPNPTDEIAEGVRQALRRQASLFLGIQETSALLTRASVDYPEVVKEVLRALPMQRIAEIMRRLIEEEVPVRNMRNILETLAEAAQREKDVFALTEFSRISLKRYLSHRYAPDGNLRALLLLPELEEHLRQAVRVNAGTQQLALDPSEATAITASLKEAINRSKASVVVTSVDIRWHVRQLIETECFDIAVLSFHELLPNLSLEATERVGLPQAPMLEAA
jgi:type III secretion protein V